MVREGEQSCASHYLRHAMRADHIVHRRVVIIASKQGFVAGSRFRRPDIHFSITHFTIPIFPAPREFSSHGRDTGADHFGVRPPASSRTRPPRRLRLWSLPSPQTIISWRPQRATVVGG